MGSVIDKKDILKVAAFLGMGFYRVKENGEFVEADPIARELFGIPQDETDLSKHSSVDLYILPAERKLRINNLKKLLVLACPIHFQSGATVRTGFYLNNAGGMNIPVAFLFRLPLSLPLN